MKDHVRLLLVGETDVGKSSLLSAFVSRHFPEEVPPIVADVTLPPQNVASGVIVTIMDSSAKPIDREPLKQKMKLADCVICLYDVTRLETLDSLHQGKAF
jgi:Ras family protein T1